MSATPERRRPPSRRGSLVTYPEPVAEPTGWIKLRYLLLGITPPREYREWVSTDIETSGWQARQPAQITAGLLMGAVISGFLFDDWSSVVGGVLGAIVGFVILVTLMSATPWGDFTRRRTLRYYERRWERQLSH